MAVTRLSGGLTPGDGADPRTFPEIWNATAAQIETAQADIVANGTAITAAQADIVANGTAITGLQSDVTANGTAITGLQSDVTANGTAIVALQSDSIPTDVTSPVSGDSLVYDGSNWVNVDASATPGDNLLYNGAMQVAQRGTSETAFSSTGYYTADRWRSLVLSGADFDQTIEADGPTGSGFTKSLKMECSANAGAASASDLVGIQQRLEGQDLQGLKKGTSDAESLTLSFWVKSNVTGTYIVELDDRDNTRSISASYSIASSGTWERKTVTFDGDTSGVLDNDNSSSIDLTFFLVAGSDYTSGTLATSWAARTNANRAVGQTDLAASTGNYWQVTGVQLETGTVATGFDHKPYGLELRECQRYYYVAVEGASKAFSMASYYNATQVQTVLHFPTTMRAAPSLDVASGTSYYRILRNAGTDYVDDFIILEPSVNSSGMYNDTDASGTTGFNGRLKTHTNANASIAFDAEL